MESGSTESLFCKLRIQNYRSLIRKEPHSIPNASICFTGEELIPDDLVT